MLTNISPQQIKQTVAKSPVFADMEPHILDDLVHYFEPVFIRGGAILINEDEIGDSLYIVMSGRLRFIKKYGKKNEAIVGEVGAGGMIGELALLTGQPRAATVVAIRDSVLLKLAKQPFLTFVQQHPLQCLNIAKQAIQRLLNPTKPPVNITTIAVMPAGDDNTYKSFSALLNNELNKIAPTLLINRHLNENHLDDDLFLVNWLSEQETKFSYIIYECDDTYTPWTKLCIRQADRIISVASARSDSKLNAIEQHIYSHEQDSAKKTYIDLVLIHSAQISHPEQTNQWLKTRHLHLHFHLRENNPADLGRFIRYLTDRNIGIVLGGGGARGLAHIGVYKALKELNIPIDVISGTSAGAMVAAMIAQEKSYEEILETFRTQVANNSTIFDYTFPIISLLRGRSWRNSLQKALGENSLIEDLWIPFFCVSTNITKNKVFVHRAGSLWKSVRASISLPGIVPPVSTISGDLLIDGSVMNGLPVDLMREYMDGGKIIALSATERVTMQSPALPEGEISGWGFLSKKLIAHKTNIGIPNISEIVLETINLAGAHHQELMAKQADKFIQLAIQDFGLFDFKAIDSLVDVGYRDTLEALKDFSW